MKQPILVVMAAGLGSRFGGLKQMEAITDAGEIILDFAVYDAWKAGFNKVIFIIKEEMEEDFVKRVVEPMKKHIEVEYVFQNINDLPEGYSLPEGRTKPWGTCHAVMAAAHLIDGPFAVINADDYYGKDAFAKVRNFLMEDTAGNEYCMAGYYVENTMSDQGTVTRGVCKTDGAGNLVEIDETKNIGWQPDGTIAAVNDDVKPIEKGTVVSMNFWGFKPSMIETMVKGFPAFLNRAIKENPEKAEYLLPIEVGKLLKEGKIRVKVLEAKDKWYGVTYKEDKEKVRDAFENMKKEGKYPAKLWG
ncbi:MAG: sugar phosphate nucleotidyltransferase [Eubacteriales bacterium]|nr:sugar phosphate nucleotidyltransferase [Eubacteriales bacterium]